MSVYVTTRQYRRPVQLTWSDIVFEKVSVNDLICESDSTGTITRKYDTLKEEVLNAVNVPMMINAFKKFNDQYKSLFEVDRKSLYYSFKIPKATGGFRQIDAPYPPLQEALGRLSYILTEFCGVLYHTSAFAYIQGRSTQKALHKHADFKSEWFLKTDISGFFPNTTLEFTMKMLSMIFPLSEIMKDPEGKEALTKAVSLGFLNGGLPQGTVLSPVLCNVVLIPIDHALFGEFTRRKMVYTRYADDMHISAVEKFPYKEIVRFIEKTFKEFGAPYEIKDEKTHFGSCRGRNFMLGCVINGSHDVTVGYKNKARFKAQMTSFILDTKNGKPWSIEDVQYLSGLLSYYKMVEKEYFKKIIDTANKKWQVDFEKMLKSYFK